MELREQEQGQTTGRGSAPGSSRGGVGSGPWPARLIAAGLVAGAGVAAALWTPRGPVTSTEALAVMACAVLSGGAAGSLLRTRRGVLLFPLLYAVAFEVVSLPAEGPTVDGMNLSGIYGLLAAASGRGVHGLLVFPALIAGGLLGNAISRHLYGRAATGRGRVLDVVATGLAVLCSAALAVTVSIPARTEPIREGDGRVVPGSVAELTRFSAGGGELNVMIRGVKDSNPVLLFLPGGPGGSEFGAMRRHGSELEKDFVVATLDQRGTGSSYDQFEPRATHTVANAVSDVIDVASALRTRFNQPRIFLVGQSWGSFVGVLAAKERPDLFAAFVGVGQMVNITETDQILYRDTLAWAEKVGYTDFASRLKAAGPPPYADLLDYPMVFSHEQQAFAYDHSPNAEGDGQMMESLPVPEYSPLDTVNIVRGLLDTFSTLYPQVQNLDLRRMAASVRVPVYLAEGRFEPAGRKDLARAWFDRLDAPDKQWVEFGTSGHRPLFEQPAEFARLMRTVAGDR